MKGKCAGVNDQPIAGGEAASATPCKATCRPFVGRFRDTIDKDAGGVSAQQHSANAIEG
jgi:hypothetical protein